MERKSFELYVQTAAWVGGLAAAATGGILLALINRETPESLIFWLRLIGGALVIALAAAAYMQFHAIAVLNARERKNDAEADASTRHVAASQWVMLGGFAAVVVFLGIGLIRYKADDMPPVRWAVAGVGSAGSDAIIVMSRTDSSAVRILFRKADEEAWRTTEVEGDRAKPKP